MTKKEMLRRLDNAMEIQIENMIFCISEGLYYSFNDAYHSAAGIMLSASALGLLKENEFNNINTMLSGLLSRGEEEIGSK